MNDSKIINWLLEKDSPSIRYRTLTELLEKDPNELEVCEAKEQIMSSKYVRNIFQKMSPEGYWYYINKRSNKGSGDNVEYSDYITTHFNLAFLSELGVTKDDQRLDKAVDRYLNLQKNDGDFYKHFSCLYAYNLRSFIRMGYSKEPRVEKIINLLLLSGRADGGYLCDTHEGKYANRPAKSCIRGSIKALMAFSELPKHQNSESCKKLVRYFLNRHALFQSNNLEQQVLGELTSTIFPFIWRGSIIEILYALSALGYGQAPELERAWSLLEKKKDKDGRFILDWAPPRSYFKPEKRGEPSKWATLYAYLAYKNKANKIVKYTKSS